MKILITTFLLFASLFNFATALPALAADGIADGVTVANPGRCTFQVGLIEKIPCGTANVWAYFWNSEGMQIPGVRWDNGDPTNLQQPIMPVGTWLHAPHVFDIEDKFSIAWQIPDKEDPGYEFLDFEYKGRRFNDRMGDVSYVKCVRREWIENKGIGERTRGAMCEASC